MIVTDPPPKEQVAEREVTKTTYLLGSGAAPNPPPLLHHITPIDEPIRVRMPFRYFTAMLHFNHQTGGLETSPEEATELMALLNRAISTAS